MKKKIDLIKQNTNKMASTDPGTVVSFHSKVYSKKTRNTLAEYYCEQMFNTLKVTVNRLLFAD